MTQANEVFVNTIVHESERQRQYSRISLPSVATINEQSWPVHDLSHGGFRIKASSTVAAAALYKAGRQKVRLGFDYSRFSFCIEGDALPVYKHKTEIGYKFVHMPAHDVAMLRHVIRSYLNGYVLTVNNVISIAARNNFVDTPARTAKESPAQTLQRIWLASAPMILIAVSALLIILFVAGNIYEGMRLVKSNAGMIDGDVFTLRAQENGTFQSFLGPEARMVSKGQKIGQFVLSGGQSQELQSPCDCVVVQQSARDGEFKLMGEALYKFFPQDGAPYISTTIKSSEVARLRNDSRARVRLSGETRFRAGRVIQIMPQENEFARLKIKLDKPVKADWFGRPAYVEVVTF